MRISRNALRALVTGFIATLPIGAWAGGDFVDSASRDWSGLYIGAHVGGAWTDTTVIDLDGYNDPPIFGYDVENVFGGLQAGYNFSKSGFVFGIEGEAGYLALDGDAQYPDYVGVRGPTDSLSSLEGGAYGTIAGRAGFAVKNLLIYGKAGWGIADVEASFIDTDPDGLILVSGTSKSETIDGAVYGGGIELALGSQTSLKVEYLRLDFDQSITVSAIDNIGVTRRFQHDVDAIDTVKVGVNFKLHREPEAAPLK